MKHRFAFLVGVLGLVGVAAVVSGTAEAAPGGPNIIVFYTDDHGFADLGVNGAVNDIRTPHLDALARSGVLARHGYSTAPQCVPSRGGLMVGKFQGRFDLDSNGSALDGFNRETTIATRLQNAGYITAQFGKWHLGATEAITQHGFRYVFSQNAQRPFSANITLDGADRPMSNLPAEMYHVEGCSRAAASVIRRHRDDPFFLYVAYRAPHTPLDAPSRYTDRFPGEMPERRRQALAMISAVDDGVGLIVSTLKECGLTERTLIFCIGDNGAPLKIHRIDSPLNGDAGGWDGSLNTPLNGEKGMLSEGGIHVPFVIAWPGTIPGEQSFEHAVSALDVAATAAAVAGIQASPKAFDGVNLVPYMTGERKSPPHETLFWRWTAQSAIREGHWKLLRGGDREYLYDLKTDLEEKHNLAARHPDVAARLRAKLTAWCAELNPPGLTLGPMAPTWNDYFDHYLEGKSVSGAPGGSRTARRRMPADGTNGGTRGWLARNGSLSIAGGAMVLRSDSASGRPSRIFITTTEVNLPGPVIATLRVRATQGGSSSLTWRTSDQKDFVAENTAAFDWPTSSEWKEVNVTLPVTGRLIHIRITPGSGSNGLEVQSIELQGRNGDQADWHFDRD